MKKLFFIFGLVVCLMARTNITGPPSRPEEQKVHNINQVEMTITNYGIFGQSYSASGCWWPVGSNHGYIFGAGIWFGTIYNGDTLVTSSYIPNNGYHETEPGLSGTNYMESYNVIYLYGDNWPAPVDTFPMAPQDHVSHQDSWCCFNDSAP